MPRVPKPGALAEALQSMAKSNSPVNVQKIKKQAVREFLDRHKNTNRIITNKGYHDLMKQTFARRKNYSRDLAHRLHSQKKSVQNIDPKDAPYVNYKHFYNEYSRIDPNKYKKNTKWMRDMYADRHGLSKSPVSPTASNNNTSRRSTKSKNSKSAARSPPPVSSHGGRRHITGPPSKETAIQRPRITGSTLVQASSRRKKAANKASLGGTSSGKKEIPLATVNALEWIENLFKKAYNRATSHTPQLFRKSGPKSHPVHLRRNKKNSGEWISAQAPEYWKPTSRISNFMRPLEDNVAEGVVRVRNPWTNGYATPKNIRNTIVKKSKS